MFRIPIVLTISSSANLLSFKATMGSTTFFWNICHSTTDFLLSGPWSINCSTKIGIRRDKFYPKDWFVYPLLSNFLLRNISKVTTWQQRRQHNSSLSTECFSEPDIPCHGSQSLHKYLRIQDSHTSCRSYDHFLPKNALNVTPRCEFYKKEIPLNKQHKRSDLRRYLELTQSGPPSRLFPRAGYLYWLQGIFLSNKAIKEDCTMYWSLTPGTWQTLKGELLAVSSLHIVYHSRLPVFYSSLHHMMYLRPPALQRLVCNTSTSSQDWSRECSHLTNRQSALCLLSPLLRSFLPSWNLYF